MAYSLHFDGASRVLLVRFEGVVARQDLERLRADTGTFVVRHGSCDGIVDFTGVTRADLDASYLRALGGRPRVMVGSRRILVAPQPEMFGLTRMYGLQQSLITDNEPMVVHTLDEAYAHLGLTSPRFAPLAL
jgi:hypothetical protein